MRKGGQGRAVYEGVGDRVMEKEVLWRTGCRCHGGEEGSVMGGRRYHVG